MLLVVLPLMSWGQGNGGNGFVVKGIVADSLTMQGEPYATIRIYHAGDRDEAVVMFVSDDNGLFRENLPASRSALCEKHRQRLYRARRYSRHQKPR